MTQKIAIEIEKNIIDLYENGMPMHKIYKKLNVAKNTVCRVLNRNNIERRSNGGRYKISEEQRKEIVKLYSSGVHISIICKKFNCAFSTARKIIKESLRIIGNLPGRKHVWTEQDIKNILEKYKSGKSQIAIANSYGVSQSSISTVLTRNNIYKRKLIGSNSPLWNGGKSVIRSGYCFIKLYPTDRFFDMVNSSGYILEHRLIMAKYLNRSLTQDETVHHIDGNVKNNNIENLQLRQTKHGKGVCYKCLDCGSFNITNVNI